MVSRMASRPRHERYAVSFAEHLFVSFLDPTNHGPRFTWERFPEMVAGLVGSSLGTAYARLPADISTKEAMDLARQHARHLMDAHTGALPTAQASQPA